VGPRKRAIPPFSESFFSGEKKTKSSRFSGRLFFHFYALMLRLPNTAVDHFL
jgi:hypothetical protein